MSRFCSCIDFFDFISNSVLMPIVALLTCISIGFFIKPQTIIDEVEINRNIVPISATKIREALLNGKQQDFMNMMPEALWDQYEYLRDKVREIYND